jgi:heme/copper-type cytochrome/quinol oxidase subunit 4
MVWCLVLVAVFNGLCDRTPGEPQEYVTPRGERALLHGSGLYRFDPAPLAIEGMVWDAANMAVALPLLALSIIAAWRGSLRGRVLLAGLLFYFFYTYFQLFTTYVFNRMFLVYVGVVALSGVAFFLTLGAIEVPQLAAHVHPGFPRRLFIGFAFAVCLLLVVLWMARIVPIMKSGRFPPELAGLTTLTTQGFDLGLVVPLFLCTGILLLRRSAWGYLLTGVCLGYALVMSVTLPAWIVYPMVKQGSLRLVEAIPFGTISLVGITLAALFFLHLREE